MAIHIEQQIPISMPNGNRVNILRTTDLGATDECLFTSMDLNHFVKLYSQGISGLHLLFRGNGGKKVAGLINIPNGAELEGEDIEEILGERNKFGITKITTGIPDGE